MAERKNASSNASSAGGTRSGAGFELRLERGGAYVRLADQPIAPGLRLESLTLHLPDVKFPFDVGQGAAQFRHRLADLVEMTVVAEPSLAEAALGEAGLFAFGIEDVRVAFREGFVEVAGRLSGGPAFTMRAGFLPRGEQGLALTFHSPLVLGPSPLPAAALPHVARQVREALGEERLPEEPLAPLLRRILAGRGWKLPRIPEARLGRIELAGGKARVSWDRASSAPSSAPAGTDLLAAEEGARAFREAEAHVARGDHDAAREAYLAQGPAGTSHPFAAERLLSLLSLDDRFHEEALDLAAEWLSRRPGFPPALATEAAVRIARGEDARAAKALAELAHGAAGRGEVFTALAAAEAAFSLPGAAREDALRAVETALGLRRDQVPALRALRALARASGDREALLRANKRLVAYDPDPASKARAHAELGELLLEADPPAARLHLDQALRLAPDDADALAALSKACGAAGEPLRAVRALDRLRELHLARGDRAAVARAAVEAGALWEDRLDHPENALLRYREACELAPSADAHARTARAAEKAGQWAEAADHHSAVLASLDPSAEGAAALAVGTRIALAEVAEKRLGDRSGAAAHLTAAAALAPADASLLRRLAALERALGRTAGLVAALDRLAPLEPDPGTRAALLAEAGEGALVLGRAGDARSRFAAAIAADGACRPALEGLARLSRERGDAVAERDALRRLLPLAAGREEAASIQDRLADACDRSGDLAGAVEAAAAARELQPTGARLDAALRLVRRSGEPARLPALLAERAKAAAAEGDAGLATEALLERARLLAPANPSLALAALGEARALSPGDPSVLRAQADLAERTGDSRAALGSLRALLAAAPGDAPALDLRAARAALATGEIAAAREHAERALDRGAEGAAEILDEILDRTGDDGARAEVLARLGRHLEAARLFERHGDPARALAALERAAEDPALAARALPRLADLRLSAGDRPGAARALLELARAAPGAEGARLAMRAFALGRDPGALDLAVERDPSFAPPRARRAALSAAADPRAALADAEAALAGHGLEEEERPELLALAARAAAAAGDGEAARRHLAGYCEANPDDDAALGRLASLHRAAGSTAELARVLERRLVTAAGAEAASVRVDLSGLVAASDPARGARLALEALERDPSNLGALRALSTPPRSEHLPASERAAILARLAGEAAAAPAEAGAAHAARASLLASAGDEAGALAAAREAVRLGVESEDLLDLHAALARRAGDPREAAEALLARARRSAARGDAVAAEQLAEAGLAALAAKVPGAEEALRDALALGPERETARAVLEPIVSLCRERGDPPGERKALASLVPLLPTGQRPPALLRLSALALEAGDAALARTSAEEARTLSPRSFETVEAARLAALAAGDMPRVADLLGELAALEPASAGPRLLERARLLAALGRAVEADAAFAEALAALPPDRALAEEQARLRREALAGKGAAEPLEAFALRTADPSEAAHALRAAAAIAFAADDHAVALRCARRAYARTQDDLAFAGPLLARLLYVQGAGAEALVLHRRLFEAGFPGVSPEDLVPLCRQTAELAEDAGEREVALAALDRLLELRPQEIEAALRRFALEPDRARAVQTLSEAAEACRSRRRRVLALVEAARGARADLGDAALSDRLFRRAGQDAARSPGLAVEVARARAAAVRATEGSSSREFLAAIHEVSSAAQEAGDREAARDLLEQAVDLQRERGLFAEAAHDLLQLDALAAAEGDFDESAGRVRAAAALLREAGDLDGAAEALRSALASNPESEETARQLEEVARAMGARGAPLLVELLEDRVARAPPGARAGALVALSDARTAAGAPLRAEEALRVALAEQPDHEGAEARLLDLVGEDRRPAERARLLLLRAAGAEEGLARALRREAAEALAASPVEADRARAAELLRRAAEEAPQDAGAARAAARALLSAGRREEAIPHLAAIVRADPDDEEAARELAEAYAGRHRERAELFASRAERARGEERAARLREAARAWFASGEDARAKEALVEAFAAWPADSAAFAQALRDAASDPTRLDAVLLARAAAVPEEAAACHRARADALRAFGDLDGAAGAYEAALAADPGDVEALAGAASCAAEARGDEAALALDERMIARWESSPAVVPGAAEAPSRYRLGLALLREGRREEALPHLERAAVLAPSDERALLVWAALADGHAARGDLAAALSATRVRASRARALGREEELRAALAAERDLSERLGLSAPSLPGAEAPEPPPPVPPIDLPVELSEGPAEAGEPSTLPDLPPEEEFSFEGAPPGGTSFDDAALEAAAGFDADPLSGARAAAERAEAAETPAGRAAAWIASAEALARAASPADEVRSALDLACDADPDSALPWKARARIETFLGDPVSAARAHLSVSIRTGGDEAAAAALEAARLFEGLERHADAARAYRAALHAKPGSVPEGVLAAAEALATGDAGAAADRLAGVDASSLPPEARARHVRILARALEAAGRSAEAEAAWTEILRESPSDPEAFARAAPLALARGGVDAWADLAAEHERALAAWGEVERRRDLRHERGRLFAAEGRLEAARGALLAALELDPTHVPSQEDLSALDARDGDWRRAVDALAAEAAAAADGAEGAAIYLRAARILAERLGDVPGAIAALHGAVARAKASATPAALRTAGEAELLLADLGGAPAPAPPPSGAEPGAPADDPVASVLRAQADAATGSERADLLERLASHLERAGDLAAAAAALASAVETDPSREGTFSWLLAVSDGEPGPIERAERARTAARAASADSFFAPPGEAAEPAPAAGDLPPAPEEAAPGAGGEPVSEEEAFSFEPGPGTAEAEGTPVAEEAFSFEAGDGAGAGDAPVVEEAISFDGDGAGSDAPALEEALSAPTSYEPDSLAKEGRACMERGDFPGAHERLTLALTREPSDLTIARDLSRVAEQLGLFDEYLQLGELCADAIAAYDPLAAAARFRHFAEVATGKLSDPDRASVMLEKALALVPEDADARRALLALWSSRPVTAPRALDAWLELARQEPSDGRALAGVAEVCERIAAGLGGEEAAHAAERGRLAASIAAFVAPAAYAPPPPARRAPEIAVELRARVAAPGATGPLARLLRLLAPWLEPLFPADLSRRGVSPADRLDSGRAPALAAALDAAARALWSRPNGVFLADRPGVEVAIENTSPPSVVVTRAVAELPDAALAFLAARTLDLLDHGWALVGKFAPRDVGILLELACRFAGGAPPSLGLPAERAGAFLAVLEFEVPKAAREAARELGEAASHELAETDPRAFAAAVRRTANRVGLLHAGDPGAALHALALLDRRLDAGPLQPAQALALPDLRDLALFALSDPFLELRTAVIG